jgi:hypothetical protein
MIYDDFDGWHETCLQCGYQVELENEDVLDYVPSKNSSDNPEIMEYETVQSGLTRKD